jgi:hypothetical protein
MLRFWAPVGPPYQFPSPLQCRCGRSPGGAFAAESEQDASMGVTGAIFAVHALSAVSGICEPKALRK